MSASRLPSSIVSEDSSVYYTGQYWNALPQVIDYMSEHFTGNPKKWWMADFKERFCPEPLGHVLVVNCGNGWVERAIIDRGIAERVTAFDYSWDLLELAARERGERRIQYIRADANGVCFAPDSFDAVFNVAALHHVQYLDRLCRILCAAIKRSGTLVSFDYIGPQRNQYSRAHWRRIIDVNRRLPPGVRKEPIQRPHLPTMLVTDPTEAIHSDLILTTMARYFDIFERHDTGGGIAYELLSNNPAVHAKSPEVAGPMIREVLDWDRHYTALGKVPPLFSYFVARPRKSVLADTARLRRFEVQEERREARARACGGVYSFADRLTLLRHRLGLAALRFQARTGHAITMLRNLARLRTRLRLSSGEVPLMYVSGLIESWPDAEEKGYFIGDWHSAGPEGAWSKGHSMLTFRVSAEQRQRYHGLALSLIVPVGAKGVHYQIKSGSQERLGAFPGSAVPRVEAFEVRLPLQDSPGGLQRIELITQDAVRPVDIGLNGDSRNLGLGVVGAQLTP